MPVNKVVRTSEGLRDVLFEELDAIRSGASNATRANAVAKLAGGVLDTVHLEMEASRFLNQLGKPDTQPMPVLKLGN